MFFFSFITKEFDSKFYYLDKICEPGTIYSPDKCNNCICSKSGTDFACTFKLCLSSLKKVYGIEEFKKRGCKYPNNI